MSPPPPTDRHVAVHVSGSVAAYKACEVITALRKNGCEVRVAMTPGAARFITAVTLQSLSGHPVLHDAWEQVGGTAWGTSSSARGPTSTSPWPHPPA